MEVIIAYLSPIDDPDREPPPWVYWEAREQGQRLSITCPTGTCTIIGQCDVRALYMVEGGHGWCQV